MEPPADLDADALEVWHRLAPDLERKGVLTHWDAEAFGIYCQAIVYNHRARDVVNRTNVMLRGQHGANEVVKNPAVQVFRDMAEVSTRIGARFGLTPSDRAQLGTGQDRDLPGEHLLTR